MKAETIIYISNLLQEHSDHCESVYHAAHKEFTELNEKSDSKVKEAPAWLVEASEKYFEAGQILDDWLSHDWH